MMLSPLDPAQPVYGYQPAFPDAPAVSIITPYDNTGPLFMQTVQSVLRQSLQQWEWIIVNDGSTEQRALQTLLPLRHADSRIRVIDQLNGGAAAARNTGVAASRAPFLFFLNSDTLLAPTALEKLVWSLVSRPASAFVTSWHVVFGDTLVACPQGFDSRQAFLYEQTVTSSVLVRRELFEQVGGFDEARQDDLAGYEFWLRCADRGLWGHDIHEYLIWIRDTRSNEKEARAFQREMRARYPRLFRDGLPRPPSANDPVDTHVLIETERPFSNLLRRPDGQRRILFLLPWIKVGGSDRFALDLVAGLTKSGDRVTVCLLRDMEHTWLKELQRIDADVFNLPAFLSPADYPRFLHYLIESRQITTVLNSNSLLAYRLLPYLRAHCLHVAYVDYLHAEEEHLRHGGFPRASIDHDELHDMHIVSSHHLRHWMEERGAEPGRIEVCTINIDAHYWTPRSDQRTAIRAELGIPDDMPLILFAGRLVPVKRPRLVIEVMRQLHLSGVRCVCVMAGDGEDRRLVQSLIRWHGLTDRVRMLGAVPNQRIRDLLAASDLLLLPSAFEGIAVILYESLAMGVVPVASDVGGQREVVTPECGVLVPHGESELQAYVGAIQQLIEEPALRRRMAEAGRERVMKHFTLDQMIERMQKLFDMAGERTETMSRPQVSKGVGLAAAALAMEFYQLEARLRTLPFARTLLMLRQSQAWRLVAHIRGLRTHIDPMERASYLLRRKVRQVYRSLSGKHA